MKKESLSDHIVRRIVTLSFLSYVLYIVFFTVILFTLREGFHFFYHPEIKSSASVPRIPAPQQPKNETPQEEEEDSDEADLEKTDPSQAAKRDSLLKLLKEKDPSSVFAISLAIEKDQSIVHNCHEIAHEIAHDIGHAAYKLYGFDGAMSFTDVKRIDHLTVQDMCAGGYVHGVLEEASLKDKNFLSHPRMLCDAVSSKSKDGCFHGVGHAVMFLHKRNVEESLSSCRLIGTLTFNSRCFEGVWMELFWGKGTSVAKYERGFDESNPFATCSATESDAKRACFLYSVFGYLRFHPKDYKGAIRECTQNHFSLDESEFCLKGVGITMNSLFKKGDFEKSEDYVTGLLYGQRYAYYQGVFGYARLSGRESLTMSLVCDKMKSDGALCKEVVSSGY